MPPAEVVGIDSTFIRLSHERRTGIVWEKHKCERPDMTTSPQRVHSNMRGVRYGEVLAVFIKDDKVEAEVYGTQMLNDCPAELWDTLDAPAIAKEMGAFVVKLNGPRHWMLDGLGTKVAPVAPVLKEFNGLAMRRIALIEFAPGDAPATAPYKERHVNRGAVFFWDKDSIVYELVDPTGKIYVMQAYCIGVDPDTSQENLNTLGDRLTMPEGWTYRSRTLTEELVVDTTDHLAIVLQDEFENSYTSPE